MEKKLEPWNDGAAISFPTDEWKDSGITCPHCGGEMQKNMRVVLTSNPVQYIYHCKACGETRYRWE